jgi:histidinol dehydrogenase
MPSRLDMRRDTFAAEFTALLATKREVSQDVDAAAAAIIADVIARGDAALADYSARFDKVDLAASGLRISAAEIAAARAACDPATLDALKVAHERITAFHEAGPAIVAQHTPGALKVHKATIVPRGKALGFVMLYFFKGVLPW